MAVCLVGSHATGTATPTSDVDIAVVGDGPHYRLEMREQLLFSVGWGSEVVQRQRLYEPDWLATHVVGWRNAVALHDPDGVAASIRHEAANWNWSLVAGDCDQWVAEKFVGLTEEVHKLISNLSSRSWREATVQRSVLAQQLGLILAIQRRILYGSENAVWQLIGDELGSTWRGTQEAALGIGKLRLERGECRRAVALRAQRARGGVVAGRTSVRRNGKRATRNSALHAVTEVRRVSASSRRRSRRRACLPASPRPLPPGRSGRNHTMRRRSGSRS